MKDESKAPVSQERDSADYIDFLKTEADHYLRVEFQCEQRASWLLGLSGVAVNAVFQAIRETYLPVANAQPLLKSAIRIPLGCAAFCFVLAASSALLTLWPIMGHQARPAGLFGLRPVYIPEQSTDYVEVWRKHYAAHRTRAHARTRAIAWAIFFAALGLLATSVAAIRNADWM